MGKEKIFECEITVSTGVREKLLEKHGIEIWEVEDILYDDPDAFSLKQRDCRFVYGRTYSGRYLLVLARVLRFEEIEALGLDPNVNFVRIITARDMNTKQRRLYLKRKGAI